MNITVGISTFKRPERVINTVGNLIGIPTLININDANSKLHLEIKALGHTAIISDSPQMFWQGMAALIRHSVTDWVLITSDEDPVIVEELSNLEKFAEDKKAGVVAAPVWANNLVKPWPESWADMMSDENPLHPSHFHDISGYISGTLLHRQTALNHLGLIEALAPTNDYVKIYTIPALVALMGLTRDAYTYPIAVTSKGEELPGEHGVPGTEYWQPGSRRIQKHHLQQFIKIITEMDADYGGKLSQAQVYERRGWA